MLTDNFTFDLGWGNTLESWKAVHLPGNVIEADGKVYIYTRKEPCIGWRYKDDVRVLIPQDYTTGILVSKAQWLYGTFEADVTLPDFIGSWPAFWLYPMADDGLHQSQYDEIDIMERFQKNWINKFQIQGNVHKNGKMTPKTKWICSRRMKLTGIWKENAVLMYVNGKLFHSVHEYDNVSHRAMNVIIGMGVSWAPKVTNDSTMVVHSLTVDGVSLL